jgi:peroxiredoxin/outer membrane lipoprotein-sorting protein
MKHANPLLRPLSAFISGLALTALTAVADPPASTPHEAAAGIDYKAKNQNPYARELLDQVKAKLMGCKSILVDFSSGFAARPDAYFDKTGEITMERPNRFKIVRLSGLMNEKTDVQFLCDGQTVSDMRKAHADSNFMILDKKVRANSFYLEVNPIVEFFFSPSPVAFDPAGALWDRPLSQFDRNASAYDKDVTLTYLGRRTLEEADYDVVEIKYNTPRMDLRQQVYIGADKLIYEIDTTQQMTGPQRMTAYKYRNYRLNPVLPESVWHKEYPPKVPVIQTDPERIGEEAPDFTLPGYNGGQFTLKELLKGKKGLFVCVIDGSFGRIIPPGADANLPEMKIIQQMKDKFEKQGLGIVCIVGGTSITPDVVKEMKVNWMPDVSRFNYPIVIDVDLERGIQGSAYENFQMADRNSTLLDSQGRVVFVADSFVDAVNNLAFYQALAQLGLQVSAADLENAAKIKAP